MLSVILLVMLAGGAGLLAYSIAEGELPIRRLRRSDQTSVEGPGSDDSASAGPDPEPTAPTPSVPPSSPPPTAPRRPSQPVARVVGRGPVPTSGRAGVPGSLTAVEGRFSEVATPWWRRLVSLAALVSILLVVSVLVAVVVGAVVGAVAELLTGAIG